MADESVEIANQQAEMARQQMELAKQQVEVSNAAIMSIAKAVDAKDVRTSQHSSRVSQYSEMLARHLGFTDAECENIRKAALVHDIGKIGIPDAILNKPGKLTDEEYARMKTHVSKGAEILKDITFIDHVVDGALYHHERWDGKGYVHGLKGEEIPLYGRIIGVADAFDAMTANRVYRNHLDKDEVIAELKRCRGTQFDPEIDDIMLSMIESGEIDMDWLYQQIDQGK
jgi:energy-coupling factor transport system substrate-specific component